MQAAAILAAILVTVHCTHCYFFGIVLAVVIYDIVYIRHSHTDADTDCGGYPARCSMKSQVLYVTRLCTFGFDSSHHVSVNLTFLLFADFFSKSTFFSKFFQQYHQIVKQFGSGSKLFAKVISK